jgi:uncharacterized protein
MPLSLKLRSLQDAHAHIEQRYEASLFEGVGDDAFRVVSPVMLAFDVDAQEAGRYRVTGRIMVVLELTCGRCLEPFTLPVTAEFDLRYVPRLENAGEGEREVDEDDLTTAFYSDNRIDLSELIVEQLHLALPMKALCSDNCKGLCPQCGTNLNASTCDCGRQWMDPRLAALRNLARKQ